MGMDVYGVAPDDPTGEYFRASIWQWPSILNAIEATGVLPRELVVEMCSNGGAGPEAEDAVRLADALDAYLATLPEKGVLIADDTEYTRIGTPGMGAGMVDSMRQLAAATGGSLEYPRADASLDFETDVAHLREFSQFARHSGGFRVW